MNNSFKKKRPLSPHLQIYKIQITSFLSILHRGTGIILYGGAIFCVLWFFMLAQGSQSYEVMREYLLHPIGLIFLLGLSFAFFYHLCNGIRHLLWDAGVGYELPDVTLSGWIVVFFSFFLTIVSWLAGMIWGGI